MTPISDARFHFGRKLTNTDISVLHQACANRPHGHQAVLDIVKLCTALGAPVNDVDCIGQTPLFYAVRWAITHPRGNTICTRIYSTKAIKRISRGCQTKGVILNNLNVVFPFSHCQAEQLIPVLLKSGEKNGFDNKVQNLNSKYSNFEGRQTVPSCIFDKKLISSNPSSKETL